MNSQVSALTISVLIALGACREDDDDDRDSIAIDSIRAGGRGGAATASPPSGSGRVAVPSRPAQPDEGASEDTESDLTPQAVSDGGLGLLFDAGSAPFGNVPGDGSVAASALPDVLSTPVGTPWPAPE